MHKDQWFVLISDMKEASAEANRLERHKKRHLGGIRFPWLLQNALEDFYNWEKGRRDTKKQDQRKGSAPHLQGGLVAMQEGPGTVPMVRTWKAI